MSFEKVFCLDVYDTSDSLHSMEIHIERTGEKYGPYSQAEVRKHLASGALRPTDLAWHKELEDWTPLGTLFPTVPSPHVSSPPSHHGVPPRSSMRFRRLLVLSVGVLAVIYLLSPYFALWRLSRALESGDRESLEARIDFPSVRTGLKEDLRAHLATAAKDQNTSDDLFGGLISAIATPLVEGMVDSLVTPSGIASLIAEGKALQAGQGTATDRIETTREEFELSKIKYAFFTSPSKFLVDVDGVKLRMGFVGTGWKVTRVEVSPEIFENAVK